MKRCYFIGIVSVALLFAEQSFAQISIDEVKPQQEMVRPQDDRVKQTSVESEYFSLAKYRAERAAIRKERNKLEIGAGLQGALTSRNDAWIATSGGDNSVSLVATLNINHSFTKNLFTVDTKFAAKFGYNRMRVEVASADGTVSNGVWFKDRDEFSVWIAPAFKMTKNWSYGATFQFRSQFANGYVARTSQEDKHLKSTFMSPGYLDVSLGITYKCPKPRVPIIINISPLALNGIFVESDAIRQNYLYQFKDHTDANLKYVEPYGVPYYSTSKYEGGSSLRIDFDRKFGKREFLRYRTTIFSFIGWISNATLRNKYSDYHEFQTAYTEWSTTKMGRKPALAIHPTVRWENTLDIKAAKFLTTTFSFQLYYNRAQNYDIQTQMLLSVGLAYTFKNK